MKYINTPFIILIILIASVSCSGKKGVVSSLPFTLEDVFLDKQQNRIFFDIPDKPDSIKLISIFYKGNTYTITTYSTGVYVASLVRPDKIISSDRTQEINNPLPELFTKPPVDLASGESLLYFSQSGKEKYYRLARIRTKVNKD